MKPRYPIGSVVVATLMATLAAPPTMAAPPDDRLARSEAATAGTAAILEAELERRPGGVVVGDEIRFPSGETFVAVDAGTLSLSQCTTGRFCGWAQSNYSGSFYYTTGTSTTKNLTWTARSYSNNRTQAARLYDSSGSASLCFTPGQDRATVGSTYYSPDKVFLSGSSSC